MSDQDHLELARAVLTDPSAYPDPEAELVRLRDAAPADERFMYEMLFEGLALALQRTPRLDHDRP